MRSRSAVLAGLVGVLLAGPVSACGVRPQERPEPLTVPAPPAAGSPGATGSGGPRVTLYLVRDAQLAPVERRTAGTDAAAAVEQLTAGPTRSEVLGGLRTALTPQALVVDEGLPGGTTAVSVSREFTGVTGGNQLLAVAQVVWTLTELEGTTQVRFLVDGVPVEVPTDEGLTDLPVDRDDYGSVAPAPTRTDPAPSSSGAPAGD